MAAYKDKKRGTWYVSFYYKEWTGKITRKMKRGFKTKKEALRWEHYFKTEQAGNLGMTFEEFFKIYTKDRRPRLKQNTWDIKENIVKTKIMPYFKGKNMNEIHSADIIQWQNSMLNYRNQNGNPYKPAYLKIIQAELSAIFNHAVRFYELRNNPVIKAGPLGSGKSDEMLFWTKDEYFSFSQMIVDNPISYHAFQLLYWCGLRTGELLALTPVDFDFGAGILHITKSLQRIHGENIITEPKTPKSKRDIQMPDFLCWEMQKYICNYFNMKSNERIFQISKNYLRHEMDRGTKKAGIKRIRIHDLRHSHISLLIHMGFSAVSIGSRVGHESQDITYRYAHMFPSEQLQMGNMLNRIFCEESPQFKNSGNEILEKRDTVMIQE